MSACLGCGTRKGVREALIHDIGADPAEPDVKPYCRECLTKLGIYCERHHTEHFCAHDSSDEDEGLPHDRSACPICTLEMVGRMSDHLKLKILAILEVCGDTEPLFAFAEDLDGAGWFALCEETDRVLIGLVLSATLNDMTVDDYVTNLAGDTRETLMH